MRHLIAVAALFAAALASAADTLKITTGESLTCTVLQENADNYVVLSEHRLKRIPKGNVEAVERSKEPAAPSKTVRGPAKVPGWEAIVTRLAKHAWASNLREIPATVIDTGPLRNVPYRSFQCGTDYEVNIYGDPDAPVAVEIGVYRSLLNDAGAKKSCMVFLSMLLDDPTDQAIALALDTKEDLVTRKGITIEVTPPTAKDAYGGWWISIYNDSAIDAARASEEELKAISEEKAAAPQPKPMQPTVKTGGGTGQRAPAATPEDRWQADELARARSYPAAAPSGGGSSGGRVYVKGYYRKDGTYVRGHSRRK
ncbi:MAG TPA: hypothetical protein VEB22_07485 [Phycisphaerales bacterium]|nr:hypothetical protein [Phycisphaerales bacterium]